MSCTLSISSVYINQFRWLISQPYVTNRRIRSPSIDYPVSTHPANFATHQPFTCSALERAKNKKLVSKHCKDDREDGPHWEQIFQRQYWMLEYQCTDQRHSEIWTALDLGNKHSLENIMPISLGVRELVAIQKKIRSPLRYDVIASQCLMDKTQNPKKHRYWFRESSHLPYVSIGTVGYTKSPWFLGITPGELHRDFSRRSGVSLRQDRDGNLVLLLEESIDNGLKHDFQLGNDILIGCPSSRWICIHYGREHGSQCEYRTVHRSFCWKPLFVHQLPEILDRVESCIMWHS